jgi:hypothetical protein
MIDKKELWEPMQKPQRMRAVHPKGAMRNIEKNSEK